MPRDPKSTLLSFFSPRRGLRGPILEAEMQPVRVPAPGAANAKSPDHPDAIQSALWDEHGEDLKNLAYLHAFKGHQSHLSFPEVVAHHFMSRVAVGGVDPNGPDESYDRLSNMTVGDLADHAYGLADRAYNEMGKDFQAKHGRPAFRSDNHSWSAFTGEQ